MNKEIINLLKDSLDLNEKESTILYNILIYNNITAYKISKITGYTRSEVYDITSKLVRKSLIISNKINNVKTYNSTQKILKENINIKKNILESTFKLISENKKNNIDLEIDILTGKKGINLIVKEMIDTNKDIYIWNYGIDAENILSFGSTTYLKIKVENKKVKNINTYYLVPENINPVTGPNYYIKKYKSKNNMNVIFWLYGGKYTIIGIWENEGTFIRIKNKKVYQSYLESFKIMFNNC